MITTDIAEEITPAITFLRGEFALWKYKIPYYSSVLPLSFVADKFSLVDEIPDSERVEWELDELFQRDIAWERIDEGLIKYLRNENQPQFFNALTIALLPKKGHGFNASYDESIELPPLDEKNLEEYIEVGGIQLYSFTGQSGTAGRLRWAKDEIIAVAVDGQHRLAAIKKLCNSTDKKITDKASVPVIFLIPHEKTGYREPERDDGAHVITSLRRVFIDLNKNARSVSRARNILLDDQDFLSVCTRSLMGTKLSSSIEKDRLPLATIDWVSDKNKFESGPYITTVLNLYDIVGQAVKIDDVQEPEEEQDDNYKRWLKTALGLKDSGVTEILEQADSCVRRSVPVTFLPKHINMIKDAFIREWRPSIIRIFNEISPYRALLKYEADNGLLRPEFANLYICQEVLRGEHSRDKAHRIRESLENDPVLSWTFSANFEKPIAHIEQSIKKDNWFFKVVFQKALFMAYFELLPQASEFIEVEGMSEIERRASFTTYWVEGMNLLCAEGLAITQCTMTGKKNFFWAGIGLSAEGSIEYTKVSSNRIREWLKIWFCLYMLEDVPTYKQMEKDEGTVVKFVQKSIKKSKGGLIKLANVRADSITDLEKEAAELAEERYTYLRKILKSAL